jgi:hypothetical protein
MNRISVGYRILLIVACTLAGGKRGEPDSAFEQNSSNFTCSAGCASLQRQVNTGHVVFPFVISFCFWAFMTVLSVLFKAKHRSLVVRALFWPVNFLCLSLWIAYYILHFHQDKVMAYAWSLHASGIGMLSFSPKKIIVRYRTIYHGTPVVCSVCICLYAWSRGPPVGIAPWIGGNQAQCGWMVHLVAVLGSDLLAYLLSPLGALLWAN